MSSRTCLGSLRGWVEEHAPWLLGEQPNVAHDAAVLQWLQPLASPPPSPPASPPPEEAEPQAQPQA